MISSVFHKINLKQKVILGQFCIVGYEKILFFIFANSILDSSK